MKIVLSPSKTKTITTVDNDGAAHTAVPVSYTHLIRQI